MKYNITSVEGNPNAITLFHQGKPYVVTPEHTRFTDLVDALTNRDHVDSEIMELISARAGLSAVFNRLSERVTINAGGIYFDGDLVENSLADRIVSYYMAGVKTWEPLVRFMEKIAQNPNEHSRVHLFDWVDKNHVLICGDGDIIGYKAVHRNGKDGYISSATGKAMVNGVIHNGQIPTTPGCVVEMPRSEVAGFTAGQCSSGLHVGTWSYARDFASVVLLVKINPRDVGSADPASSGFKIRVCRYYVTTNPEVTAPIKADSETGFYKTDPIDRIINFTTGPRERPVTKRVAKVAKRTSEISFGASKRPTSVKASKVAAKRVKDGEVRTKLRPQKTAKAPKFFDDFKLADFRNVEFITWKQMLWLAKEWEVKPEDGRTRVDYEHALNKAAQARRRKYAAKPRSVKRTSIKANAATG